jgi:hypothetical protein
MSIEMTLGGISLGPDFPLFTRAFEFIRNDEQGPSFRRIKMNLAGFLNGDNSERVMQLYQTLEEVVGKNDVRFTYIENTDSVSASGVTVCDERVWVSSYNEPQDDYGHCAAGDYSIELYYFKENQENLGIECSYNGYGFEDPPKFGRSIEENRETHRARLNGSTAIITLTGFLYADTHPELVAKIEALTNAFTVDATLHYGSISQAVRVTNRNIQENVLARYAYYTLTMKYDIGEIVSLRRKISIPRVHQNPVITEEPFCSRRLIELMNTSSQTITYSLQIEAESIPKARELLASEAVALIEPGGIEMPGGVELWDLDKVSVDLTVIKFYSNYVIGNLSGT